MREIKAAVMFANAGIGEFYARHANVKVVVAIELEYCALGHGVVLYHAQSPFSLPGCDGCQ